MLLGQPNQEDLVRFLLDNFSQDELDAYKAKMMINLSPVAYEKVAINKETIISDSSFKNKLEV